MLRRSRAVVLALWCVAAMIVAGCAGAVVPAQPATLTRVNSTHVPDVAAGVGGVVVAAPPQWLDIPSLGVSTNVAVMETGQCPVLNPPTSERAYWVQCRAKSGTDSDGTVFVIGHAVAGGDAVFNTLPDIAIGADVTIVTANGSLTYRVEDTAVYTKYGEAQQSSRLRERVPGRLVLVTCFLDDGRLTDKNFVAYATLTASYG